jgi:hypothetical protein
MMDAREELIREKASLLSQIAKAAQFGQSQEVIAAAEKLNKIEILIEKCESLVRDIANLNNVDPKPDLVQNIQGAVQPFNNLNIVPGREIGKKIRKDFLKLSEEGIHIEHIKGSIYKTISGSKVGVAFATERKADRWFLGLPIDLDQAVLLCQHENEDVAIVCLSKGFLLNTVIR